MTRRRRPAADPPAQAVDAREVFDALVVAQFRLLSYGFDEDTERAEWDRLDDELDALGDWWEQ